MLLSSGGGKRIITTIQLTPIQLAMEIHGFLFLSMMFLEEFSGGECRLKTNGSRNGGFHKRGYRKMSALQGKILDKKMDDN